jgi:hypothetical protein
MVGRTHVYELRHALGTKYPETVEAVDVHTAARKFERRLIAKNLPGMAETEWYLWSDTDPETWPSRK